jgi:tRNA pseudouridine38-40 synthase
LSTFNYKASFSYKGTRYLGWQIQNPGDLTVQGEILKILKEISKDFDDEKVRILGSGRTDTGVHAIDQVTKITLPLEVPPNGLLQALNSLLPDDIRAQSVEFTTEEFHPIRDAISKEYIYYFAQEKLSSPFCADLISTCTHPLDFEKMRQGLELIKGQHDFSQFKTMGTQTPTTIRNIFEAELVHIPAQTDLPWLNIPCIALRFKGDGFLKQMVRLLVGALWNVGRGKSTLSQLEFALTGASGPRVGAVAPPNGLYLKKVHYT